MNPAAVGLKVVSEDEFTEAVRLSCGREERCNPNKCLYTRIIEPLVFRLDGDGFFQSFVNDFFSREFSNELALEGNNPPQKIYRGSDMGNFIDSSVQRLRAGGVVSARYRVDYDGFGSRLKDPERGRFDFGLSGGHLVSTYCIIPEHFFGYWGIPSKIFNVSGVRLNPEQIFIRGVLYQEDLAKFK